MQLSGPIAQPVEGELGFKICPVRGHVEDPRLDDRGVLARAVIHGHDGDDVASVDVLDDDEVVGKRRFRRCD